MDDHDQQFCLRWNNHQSTIISVFGTLKENEALVDCTLAAEGKFLKAHKVVLSACSPYFATLLQEQYDKHPIFILKDVKYQELCAMMDYMYHGEVNISQDQLAALLKAAESLQIKGLSDNRSTGGSTVPKQEHHRASMPPTPKLSGGYTLEQTKRARIALGPGSIDNQEMGSREGSSSPSRRRRKMGRRSIENATTDVHDNANSSQQPPGPNAAVALSGVGAITAAASALAAGTIATSLPAGASLAGTSTSLAAPAVMSGAAISGTTTSTTKKTESLKAASQQSSDAMNTDNVQGSNLANIDAVSEHLHHHSTHHHHAGDIVDKSSNHKQQKQTSKDASGSGGGPSSELVIEPKSEYDDEGNDEAVEDLTLDEEDMAIDDLDQNAGTSQGGEGSSHGYAPWQPDRSQNELLLETQEAQQRDPQGSLTPTHSSNVTLQHQPQRPRMRLKVSPLSSPIATVAPGSSVIKFEPSSTNDEDNEDKIPTMCIEKKVSVTSAGTAVSNVGSGHGVSGCNLDDEEDDEDSEQPCDLRLSSHFKLNLVSIALQQAAAAAASGDQQTAAAMAAAVIGSGTAGSTGMPPATQLQHAALQSIAAAATSSHHHHGSSHSLHQQHSHHALMNFPTHAAAAAGAVTPTRRYSSSSAGTNLTAAAAVAVGGSSGPASVGTATNAAGTALGVSTSSAVAPHTPTSSGNVVGGGVMGASGSNSAGAPGSSGTGGSGGGNNSNTSWGGAYTCDRCGNSYARPHSLNRHVRFECGVEPKFECPICHKKSKHKHNLVLHMRTHQHR